MEVFKIKNDIILLNQLVKACGWCESGAEANNVISEGKVKVNGKTELRKRNKLQRGMVVEYNGQNIQLV